jgi:hypothetical protein
VPVDFASMAAPRVPALSMDASIEAAAGRLVYGCGTRAVGDEALLKHVEIALVPQYEMLRLSRTCAGGG